jgi:hypothetical protein
MSRSHVGRAKFHLAHAERCKRWANKPAHPTELYVTRAAPEFHQGPQFLEEVI